MREASIVRDEVAHKKYAKDVQDAVHVKSKILMESWTMTGVNVQSA